jgi:hypothetical protein
VSTSEFGDITGSGTYFNQFSGWLLRMPDEALSMGHGPTMDIVTRESSPFTRISEDPYVTLDQARRICASLDFEISF